MTTTAKLLSPEEARAYAGILRAAFAQAQAFDGSEASIQSLTDAFNAADVFVRRKVGFTGADPISVLEEFEKDFADEAGFPRDSIGQMFQQSVRDFYRNLAGAGDIYLRLRAGGAVVITTNSVFVKTKGGEILAAGENSKPFEIKTDPRLAWLTEDLQAIGIYLDDLIVHVGTVRENMVRQEPYIVIDIPRLNKQIAVCEQVGEITFVSSEILDPALYENADKDILKGIPQITPVECYNRDYWRGEIRRILEGDGTHPRRKVDVRNVAANPPARAFPLTVDLIDAMALAYNVENPGKWPTNKTSPRWQTIHSAIVNRSCGLDKPDIPKHVKGLGSYLE